jgi:hypothetical protein
VGKNGKKLVRPSRFPFKPRALGSDDLLRFSPIVDIEGAAYKHPFVLGFLVGRDPGNLELMPADFDVAFTDVLFVARARDSQTNVCDKRCSRRESNGESGTQCVLIFRRRDRGNVVLIVAMSRAKTFVSVGDTSVSIGREENDREHLRERTKTGIGAAPKCDPFHLAEALRLRRNLRTGAIEIDECFQLCAEDLCVYRLGYVVGSAETVRAKSVPFLAMNGRQKKDRNVPRALPRLDQLGRLKAVKFGHLNVEHDNRKVRVKQLPQSRHTRFRADGVYVQRLCNCPKCNKIFRLVVDEQDTRSVVPEAFIDNVGSGALVGG